MRPFAAIIGTALLYDEIDSEARRIIWWFLRRGGWQREREAERRAHICMHSLTKMPIIQFRAGLGHYSK